MTVSTLRSGIWTAFFVMAFALDARLHGEDAPTPAPSHPATDATLNAPAPAPAQPDEATLEKFNGLVLAGYEKESAGDYTGAFASYTEAIAIREDTPTVFVRRAFCAAKLNRIPEAALDLKRATQVSPRSLTDYSTMAWFYATCPFKQYRDGARAVALSQKLVSIRPSAENADLLAAGYAQMGNFQLARDTVSDAIKRYPNSPRLPALKERLALYNQKKKFEENWGIGDLTGKNAEAKPAS